MRGVARLVGAVLLLPALALRALLAHPVRTVVGGGVLGVLLVLFGLAFTFEGLPVVGIQRGPRGTGMIQQYNPNFKAAEIALNRIDPPYPPVTPAGQPASQAYRNIQVLGDVDAAEFIRLMASMSDWVAPTVGCSYCHSAVNMAEDKVYTKNVSRHMIEMVRYINANWGEHVGAGGVTCNTCHRGHGAPVNVWHVMPPPDAPQGLAETATGKNAPAPAAGLSSLPSDPYTPFLLNAAPIRVQGTTALPAGNRASVKQADWTYSLMIHFADSLGVACNFCHNTRAFGEWDQGTPQRVTAWKGIEMVRDLNHRFMVPITGLFPPGRRGPLDDVAKINCATCHQGAYKPFYGASVLDAFPELKGPAPFARNDQSAAAAGGGR